MRLGYLVLVICGLICAPLRADFRADLETRSLAYFLDHQHPISGLMRDRARNFAVTPDTRRYRIASLASTGFGLAVIAHAAARGIVDKTEAQTRIHRALEFAATRLFHHGGWLYHFVDWESGQRAGRSEISTIDTALFLAGALYAAEIFPGTELASLARRLYRRVDFADMMTDGGAAPERRTLSMGWMPESGYLPWRWDSYAEHLILVLLGLGHPEPAKRLPADAWSAWRRPTASFAKALTILGPELPLFAHQYSQLFVDFRRTPGLEKFFYNSAIATWRDRLTCRANAGHFKTYRAGFWGLSASGSPDGYQAFSPEFHNGTVCPGCAGASKPFFPDVLFEMAGWVKGPWGAQIWGRYGFIDSLNLDREWFDPDVIGITVGAQYLALAEIHPVFVSGDEIRRGISAAVAAEALIPHDATWYKRAFTRLPH